MATTMWSTTRLVLMIAAAAVMMTVVETIAVLVSAQLSSSSYQPPPSYTANAIQQQQSSRNQQQRQQLWTPPSFLKDSTVMQFESALPIMVVRPSARIVDEPKVAAYMVLSSCSVSKERWDTSAVYANKQEDSNDDDDDDENSNDYDDIHNHYYYGVDISSSKSSSSRRKAPVSRSMTEAQRAVAAARQRAADLTSENIYGIGANVRCSLDGDSAVAPPNYEGTIGLELRGRSSIENEKKSYGVELWENTNGGDTYDFAAEEQGQDRQRRQSPWATTLGAADDDDNRRRVDRKESLLGMPKEADWVLYGPFLDRALIRTPVCYHLWRAAGHWGPRTRAVELFLQTPPSRGKLDTTTPIDEAAHYQGVYILLEKVKRDPNRLDVQKKVNASTPASDHGYILETPSEYPNRPLPFGTFTTPVSRIKWAPVYPKRNEYGQEQSTYIYDYIQDFERALFNRNFRHPTLGTDYTFYVDLYSFADYVLHTELIRNVDGYIWSVFLHKNKAGAKTSDRGRLQLGPPWDMNMALANADYNYATSPQGWHYRFVTETVGRHVVGALRTDRMEGGKVGKWIARMLQDDRFLAGIKRRWRTLRRGPWANAALLKAVDDAAGPLRVRTRGSATARDTSASERNYMRWDIRFPENKPRVSVHVPLRPVGWEASWDNEVEKMKKYLLERAAWIDTQLI